MRYGSAGRPGLDESEDAAAAVITGEDGIGGCCSAGCGGLLMLSVALFGLLASHITKNTSVTTTNDTITIRVGVRGCCVKGYVKYVMRE